MDWIRAIYGVLGADYPVLSLVGAGLLGAFLFSGAWWLAGRDYRKEHPPIATEAHLPMANEGAERKVFPETAKPSAKPNAPSHQPPRAIATQQAENNRSLLFTPSANEIRLGVYHNRYAAIPLEPVLLEKYGINQYRLENEVFGNTAKWQELQFFSNS